MSLAARVLILAVILSGSAMWAELPAEWWLSNCNAELNGLCDSGAPAKVTATLLTATSLELKVEAQGNFVLWDGGTFGFNLNAPITGLSITAPTLVQVSQSTHLDGAGDFDYAWDLASLSGGETKGPTSLTFVLEGVGLSTSIFGGHEAIKGSYRNAFASHVAYITTPQPVTGYVSDGPINDAPVPEPLTLLMVGLGLAGISARMRAARPQ